MTATSPRTPAPTGVSSRRRFTVAGTFLGLGLGGFFDGIVLHQVLQWHHMLTDYSSHTSFPMTTVRSLEENTLWDGLFHLITWLLTLVGLFTLWRVVSAGYRTSWHSVVGLLLSGWGAFNLAEGIVDHHVLTIHHVRDDVTEPLWWDLSFLILGAALVGLGFALRRRGTEVQTDDATAPHRMPDQPAPTGTSVPGRP